MVQFHNQIRQYIYIIIIIIIFYVKRFPNKGFIFADDLLNMN